MKVRRIEIYGGIIAGLGIGERGGGKKRKRKRAGYLIKRKGEINSIFN